MVAVVVVDVTGLWVWFGWQIIKEGGVLVYSIFGVWYPYDCEFVILFFIFYFLSIIYVICEL